MTSRSTRTFSAWSVRNLLRDTLLFWPLVNLFLSIATLAVGGTVATWQLPVSLILALTAAAVAQPRSSWVEIGLTAMLLAIFILLAAQLSMWMVDQDWDSRAYHGPAIIALRDGWNPLSTTHSCQWHPHYCSQTFIIAVDHYPKAAWLIAAQFYALWGDLDAAKTLNLLMLLLTFLVAQHCVSRWLPNQRANTVLAALLLAGNPVVLAQLFSGYIDGVLAAVLTCLILLLLDFLVTHDKGSLWRSALVLPFLANVKMTGLVYGLLFITLGICWLAVKHREQLGLFIKWQVAAVALALLLGLNPYGSNWRDHDSPFYPLSHTGNSVIDQQAAPWFMAKDRVSQFLIATFSVQNGRDWREPLLVAPLTQPVHNPAVEARFAAFGPLFSTVLPIALLLLPLLLRDRFGLFAAAVLFSIFITVGAWWARLAPQAWTAMVLIPIGVCRLYAAGWRHELAAALMLAMLANNLLVMRSVYYVEYRLSKTFHQQLAAARQAESKVAPAFPWYDGDFGIYNRRKIADSLPGQMVAREECQSQGGNRIFILCHADSSKPLP